MAFNYNIEQVIFLNKERQKENFKLLWMCLAFLRDRKLCENKIKRDLNIFNSNRPLSKLTKSNGQSKPLNLNHMNN